MRALFSMHIFTYGQSAHACKDWVPYRRKNEESKAIKMETAALTFGNVEWNCRPQHRQTQTSLRTKSKVEPDSANGHKSLATTCVPETFSKLFHNLNDEEIAVT